MEQKLITIENLNTFFDNMFQNDVVSVNSTWNSDKINAQLGSKQDVISDLASIRSGANLGRTALQEVPAEYINETELNTRLSSYATTASVDASLATKADVYEVASLEEIESLFIPVPTGPAANEIWYITSNESVITPYAAEALPTIVSNVYENGKGVIKFASNLTTIGLNAFAQNNTNLTSITLPEGLTTLGDGCFYGCKNLTSITIPESVTLIDNSAFQNGFRAQYFHLTIPENVLTIGEWAFSSCLGIKTLTIGSSVTSIGTRAFSNLSYLETINFTGTMAQWNAITKGSKWITGVGSQLQTPPSVVHCSDGDVNL